MDIGEQLTFITVQITARDDAGNESVGTGFFYSEPYVEGHSLTVVITNKHVIENTVSGRIRVHQRRDAVSKAIPPESSRTVRFDPDWSSRWFMHPDPNIDLSAMPIGDVSARLAESGAKLFQVAFGPQHIPSDEDIKSLNSVEDILMVGYPIGLWDEAHNRPLIRRGITASDPAIDFNGAPEFVIDVACFPGSSGSPVVRSNGNPPGAGTGGHLLGVLYAGPIWTAEGRIEVRKIPTRVSLVSVTEVMVHLGNVIKAREIRTLIDALVAAAADPNNLQFNTERL